MLNVKDLCVNYGTYPVLSKVSLQVSAGEILAVIGPNGAGKTTLLRAISGVHPKADGQITVDGQDISHLPPDRRAKLLAVVSQARQLPIDFTVYETVLIGRTAYLNWFGSTQESDHSAVRKALVATQLDELSNRLVGDLSGGEQQRVLLARALAQNAPLLLLDEPTTHLDLEHQTTLLNLVRRMAAEKPLAILMVMHDLNLTGLYADRVALLVDGKIRAIGAPSNVITAENLIETYHIPVNILRHPEYGTPLVLPDGRNLDRQ